MHHGLMRTCVWQGTVALLCFGCDGRHTAASQPSSSFEFRAPGSDVSPTSDSSFQLLAADGQARFASFQGLIVQSGKRCSAVTRAVLNGGLDGTDEWRVECLDSGTWEIWFRPVGPPEIEHCRARSKCE